MSKHVATFKLVLMTWLIVSSQGKSTPTIKVMTHTSIIEKDYSVMHALWGLQQQGFEFELKGGTSLHDEAAYF